MSKNNNIFPCSEKEYCKKQKFDRLDVLLSVPFEANNGDLSKLLRFFLYKAPNISSAHSPKISNITYSHDSILREMMNGRKFSKGIDFCSSNCRIEKHLLKVGLNGNKICLKCKRGVCKRNPIKGNNKESDLDCLLRHIRNSIAHGRFYYSHGGNIIFLMFEDVNTTGNISARIVCLRADLEHWKNVLLKYI